MPKSRPPVPAGVQAAARGAGASRAEPGRAGGEVRADGAVDPQLGCPGRSRRRPPPGWPDHGRARGAAAAPAREQGPPRGAGDFEKSRGLVRSGDRLDPTEGFEFVRSHQATHPITTQCRVLGVAGLSRRKRPHTTLRDREARPAPDLVDRDFTAPGPDRLWVADITYVPTWAGFLYLAVVLDAWSRRVVGWAMATHVRTELVLEALNMALTQRRPTDVIHHSDQGCQGEFNRSSQHLEMEVLNGTTPRVDGDADRAAGDAVAGPTAGAARCGAGVLDEDRRGTLERGSGDRVWRGRPGRCSLVPRAGWHAVDPAHPTVGAVPVVRRARRHRAAPRARSGCTRDRPHARPDRREASARPGGAVHRSSPRSSSGPTVGNVVEPRADLESVEARLPRGCDHEDIARGDLSGSVHPGPRRAQARARRLSAYWTSAACAPGTHEGPRQAVRHPGDHDHRAAGRRR